MRKLFAIVVTIIGISLALWGVILFNSLYLSGIEMRQIEIIGMILSFSSGIVLTITGLIMIIRKPVSQRKKEAEYDFMKKIHSLDPEHKFFTETEIANIKNTLPENFVEQIEKLGKLKEQGLITEDEFQNQKKKILG